MGKLLIAFFIVALTGCATTHDNGQARRDAYEARLDAIWLRADAKELSYVAAAQQQVQVARDVYPDDYQLHALREYKVLLADRFERGTITRAEFEAAWGERLNTLLAQRQAQYQQQQAAAEQYRLQAMQQGLNSFRRSMDRNFPQPIHCTSSNSFGVVTTNCR